MTRELAAARLTRCVGAMGALEARIEERLDRLRGEVEGHPGTAAAFERFHAIATEHREHLAAHLRELRGPTGHVEAPGSPPPAAAGGGGGSDVGDGISPGPVARALREAYLAFNEAAVGYGVLHEMAHVCDSVRFAATLRLAERHLRAYAQAAQALNQLLAEVVAWELRREGQSCDCQCPSCGLGICWCIAHTTDAINTAWRETAPARPSPGLRVAPNPRRPADLDVREGDRVIAVDGQRVATTADVTTAVMRRGPGEPITFGIERPSVGTLEVTTRRR